jgi:hypothetical protein
VSSPTSTLNDLTGAESARSGRRWRGIGLLAFLALDVAALVGVFGPTEQTITASSGGYEMRLAYPHVTRSGQPAAPYQVRVTHPGGFAAPIRIAFDEDVFDRFDFQNWYPNPESETGEPGEVVYQFSRPPGDVFELTLDARTAPRQFSRDSYWVTLLIDGAPMVRIDYTVWIAP